MSVHAADTLSFDFRGKSPTDWEIQGWTGVSMTPQGLDIRTASDGGMFTAMDPNISYQVVTITTTGPKATDALALWNDARGEMIQMPFVILGGEEPVETHVVLWNHPQFSRTNRFGLALPSNTTIAVQEIRFSHYGFFEQLWTTVRSLFTFDRFQTFSINFLWGPLFTGFPEEIETLYQGQPPRAHSAMRLVYIILAISIAVALAHRFRKRRSNGWTIVATTAICLWLLLDLRMSAELLSYAANDWKTYITKPVSERVLRDRLHYYRTVESSAEWLKTQEAYGVLTSWPILGNLRYFTYPARPVTATTMEEGKNLKRWFVFSAPDASLVGDVLHWKGQPVSGKGRVTRTFGDGAFIFEVL